MATAYPHKTHHECYFGPVHQMAKIDRVVVTNCPHQPPSTSNYMVAFKGTKKTK